MTATVDGARIRTVRSELGIRQYRLAKLAGISTYWLRRIELHGQQPSELVLCGIAGALKVDPDELMSEPSGRRTAKRRK
jgi:transcriptional regulator with XRE-family HTH domain